MFGKLKKVNKTNLRMDFWGTPLLTIDGANITMFRTLEALFDFKNVLSCFQIALEPFEESSSDFQTVEFFQKMTVVKKGSFCNDATLLMR